MQKMTDEQLRDALLRRLHVHSRQPRRFDYFGWLDSRHHMLYRRDRRRWQRALRQGRWLPSGELVT